MPILCLATDQGKFEIVSGMLTDYQTYVAVANFLHFHAQSNAASRTIFQSKPVQIHFGPKMGKINVAAYGMALGTIGQSLLLAHKFGHVSRWTFLPLLGPWLLAHAISFCRVPPCGPRRFALLLSISVWWYSLDTLVSEFFWMLAPTATSRIPDAVIAHAIAYGGASSFVVLIRAIRDARTFAENHPESA